jgi:hypothetical protein
MKNETVTQCLRILPPFNAYPITYNDPPIYRDGGRWQFSPKPLVVIFFRAPGGRDIYKKPLELTQRPTNPYMGWATPPTASIFDKTINKFSRDIFEEILETKFFGKYF